eukprot:scaffold99084_cov45-Attheya_sp.AAC.1
MKKRDRIISKVKSKYWARTHKYGIRVPKHIKEAKEIDLENGDTQWMDSVRLEMKNVRIAFEEYDGNPEELIGYEEITGHLVFDVKLGENFRRKTPLNDLDILGADVQNAFLTAPNKEKVWIWAGPGEFGPEEGT